MDTASLVGVVLGVGLIIGSILMGSEFSLFVNYPGLMIVAGGTVAATLLTFPFDDVKQSFKAAAFVFAQKKEDPNDMIETMIEICTISRKQGLVALSKLEIEKPFLRKACNLIADGSEENLIRDTLTIELDSMKQRHFIVQDIFTKMGLYAPAFGMIGTLIGLIQMLNQLSNPDNIGPLMAVALLTTFYGSMLASMFFNPIAGKLKSRTVQEVANLEIMFEGAVSILESNNPMMVYEKLSAFIPGRDRRPMQKKGGKK
ncbi:MAG: MotA/TolQ/ExbB proton channel family protein [Nitrospinota bacterium]|nr:MotA/TolQ/ExbB proton channel family protein [Nitrospinota bacterium]